MSNGISIKGKEDLPLSHEVQSGPFAFQTPQRSLGAAGSRLSPKIDQCFISEGFRHMGFISIHSACYQSHTEYLLCLRDLSPPRVRTDRLVSGKM